VSGLRIKKGDRVVVLTGKDRGKKGDVLRVLPKEGKVVVEGVNIARRHTRATRTNQQAGIIDKVMPLPVANVAVISPGDGKATRVGYRFQPDGTKVRICKRTGADL
jgi:large subunit ribosomal protein L24